MFVVSISFLEQRSTNECVHWQLCLQQSWNFFSTSCLWEYIYIPIAKFHFLPKLLQCYLYWLLLSCIDLCVHSRLGALSVGLISCQSETVRKIGSETNTHVVITSDSVHNHSGECCIISHISSLISRLLRKPGTKAAPVTPYNFTRLPCTALYLGHSQILSHSHGEKSGESLWLWRLAHH